MDTARLVFESFNQVISQAYDDYISYKGEEALRDLTEGSEELRNFLRSREDQWSGKELEELEGRTPAGFFRSIGRMRDLLELFKKGAAVCDERLPYVLTEQMKLFGEESVRALLDLASDDSFSDDDFQVPLTAVRTIGQWRSESAAASLVGLMTGKYNGNELFMEELKNALENIGTSSLPHLIESLNGLETDCEAYEYLLMALASIGCKKRSDEIYYVLKNSFIKMVNKPLGAACLASYGDGRAIPALRGYVEKNLSSLDIYVLSDIKAAIEKLGGNIDDLIKSRHSR